MAHIPVLLNEVIKFLDPKAGELIIDGTIGSAGHSLEVLKGIGPNGKLLGIDWDEKQIAKCKTIFGENKNVILVQGNYADILQIIERLKLGKADGLLLDLGFSSEQLEGSGRGFSFKKDEPLDMRYDTKVNDLTAREVINSFNEKELADIFYEYGEERYSRRIARAVVENRRKKSIETTGDLVQIVESVVPAKYFQRISPATRVFQALRIYVNEELSNLEKVLSNLEKILKNKGRVVIISFHSLEDRLVKNYFKKIKSEGKGEILTKKPITASPEEISTNPRSRKAKLRALIIGI